MKENAGWIIGLIMMVAFITTLGVNVANAFVGDGSVAFALLNAFIFIIGFASEIVKPRIIYYGMNVNYETLN